MNAAVPKEICPAKPSKMFNPKVVIVKITTGIITADIVKSQESPGSPKIGIKTNAKTAAIAIPILSSNIGKAASSSLYFDLN